MEFATTGLTSPSATDVEKEYSLGFGNLHQEHFAGLEVLWSDMYKVEHSPPPIKSKGLEMGKRIKGWE